MAARLYQPAKTATSSGRAKTRFWLLEMEPEGRKTVDPLCGWSGSGDTEQQIQLKFPTREAALAYAKRNDIEVRLSAPRSRIVRPKSYADNFTRSS
jgi:NADH dehydrogenase